MNARLVELTDELQAAIETGDTARVRELLAAHRMTPRQRVEVVRALAATPPRRRPPTSARLVFDRWDRARIAEPAQGWPA